mgnify:FL=1
MPELNQANPADAGGTVVADPQNPQQTDPNAGNQDAERVYAGKYKTVEDLESGYTNANRENTRMAQELARLNQQLQAAQTPKQAEKIQDKIDDLSYFDPETGKALSGYVQKQIAAALEKSQNDSRSQSEFSSQITQIWEETKKLYPEAADPNSKLYQRANQLLFERGLAKQDNSGALTLATPFAYRIAVEAAAQELSRQAPEAAATQVKRSQAGAIQGRSSKSVPQGKLTFDQYSKLSDEEKNAYDEASIRK